MHDTARVPKRLLKLRAPQQYWRICPAVSPLAPVSEVDDHDAAVSTLEKLKSPSPIVNRLRPKKYS